MLVLGRKINEAIRIGRDIRIRVVDIQAGIVRLGIEAPRDRAIWRDEILVQIEKENHRATQGIRLCALGDYEPLLPISPLSPLNRLKSVRTGEKRVKKNATTKEKGGTRAKTARKKAAPQNSVE